MQPIRGTVRSFLLGAWAGSLLAAAGAALAAGAVELPAGEALRLLVDPVPGRAGLLDRLLPPFEAARGVRVVAVVAASSKEALKIGAAGGADAVLVHAPRQEVQYVNQGFYLDRRLIMRMEYILAGPPADPARVKGTRRPVVAFRRIADRQVPFVSREGAGSRLLEQEIWGKAGVSPRLPWYISASSGRDELLALAAERGAYLLIDRPSASRLPAARLVVILEGVGALRSDFSYLEVNPHRFPRSRYEDARALGDYLLSAPAQELIGDSGAGNDGSPAFLPAREPAR